MISKKALQILNRAGWLPDRKINIDQTVTEMTNNGICVSEKAATFLESFGNLSCSFSTAETETESKSDVYMFHLTIN